MSLGSQVKQLREEQHWTQGELARRIGGTQRNISAIERGETKLPSAKLLRRLADTFNVPETRFLQLAGYIPEQAAESLPGRPVDSELDRLARMWPTLDGDEREHIRYAVRGLMHMIWERRGERE